MYFVTAWKGGVYLRRQKEKKARLLEALLVVSYMHLVCIHRRLTLQVPETQ